VLAGLDFEQCMLADLRDSQKGGGGNIALVGLRAGQRLRVVSMVEKRGQNQEGRVILPESGLVVAMKEYVSFQA